MESLNGSLNKFCINSDSSWIRLGGFIERLRETVWDQAVEIAVKYLKGTVFIVKLSLWFYKHLYIKLSSISWIIVKFVESKGIRDCEFQWKHFLSVATVLLQFRGVTKCFHIISVLLWWLRYNNTKKKAIHFIIYK